MNIDEFLQENNIGQSSSSQNFVIKQGRYEGPYTKLLEMIEKRKLSISEISLSKIADEYIEYIKNLESVNPLDMSQFVQIASTLMLIKAKSLLAGGESGDPASYFISNGTSKTLPCIKDGGFYKNINIISFQIPVADKEILTERVRQAGKYLVEQQKD